MSEKILSDATALALSGTTDTGTGAVYPTLTINNWAATMYRWMHRLLGSTSRANQLRVCEVDGNADAVAIKAGRVRLGGTDITYAGADPAVDGLTNNDITYVWLTAAGAISSAIDGTGWPATVHMPLAEVTMASGAITAIVDARGRGWSDTVIRSFSSGTRPAASIAGRTIWNTTTSKINIDTGAAWVLADGTAA